VADALVPVVPNIFAILFWLIAPLITNDVIDRLKGSIRDHLAKDKQPEASPIALSIDQQDNYVTWASDLIQVPAAGLLPVVGAVIGLVGDLNAVAAVVIIMLVVLATFACYFRVAGKDPSIYTKTKYCRYNAVPAFAIIINLISGVAMVVGSPFVFEHIQRLVSRV
jgi:hypothetical protein